MLSRPNRTIRMTAPTAGIRPNRTPEDHFQIKPRFKGGRERGLARWEKRLNFPLKRIYGDIIEKCPKMKGKEQIPGSTGITI